METLTNRQQIHRSPLQTIKQALQVETMNIYSIQEIPPRSNKMKTLKS